MSSIPASQITLRVADTWFCVDVHHAVEVLPAGPVTPVPLSAPALLGIFNHRGSILPLLDLKTRLSLPASAEASDPSTLIVRWAQHRVGLLVDEIGDVVTVDAISREPCEERGDLWHQRLVSGVAQVNHIRMLMLDLEVVLAPPPSAGS